MENLFFDLQKDKRFKRQVSLLRYLNTAAQPLNTNDTAAHLGCSKPTLASDIELLNDEFGEQMEIYSSLTGELFFTLTKESSIDSLVTDLAKDTLVYHIIDSIFHNRKLSMLQALGEFAVSRSKLLGTIYYMNDVLQLFNISIATATLQFQGREEDIRLFLFDFYASFGDMRFIGEEVEAQVKDLMKDIEEMHIEPRLHFSYFRMSIWLAVAKYRWVNNDFVELPKWARDDLSNRVQFSHVQEVIQKFYQENISTKTLPYDEMLWVLIASLDCISYSDELKNKEGYKYRREEKEEIVKEIRSFLATVLSREYFEDNSVERLEAFLVNQRLLSTMTPNFELVPPRIKELILGTHQEFYELWYTSLQSLPEDSCMKFYYLEDVAVILTMLHTTILKYTETTKKVHVLFAFQGANGFDDYLAKVSKMLLLENVSAEYFLERTITSKMIKEKQADLVICNYDLAISQTKECPILRLSNIPTLLDWGNARDMLERMLSE